MLRIVVLPLLIFLFSMACMGQTFQYSRGWTNGKRAGGSTSAGFNRLLHKDDDSIPELFEIQETNERRLERCLLQLQRFVRNSLLLHSSAGALALTPSASASPGGNGDNNSNINNINNPFGRSHQSNEMFEELGAGGAIIDTNDYGKH